MNAMISVAEALVLLAQHRFAPDVENVPLDDALDRVLATDIAARITLPPHDASAMDGYAVRFADMGERLRVIGKAPAGVPFVGAVSAGEAVRIFTGSDMPDGADHVMIQEDVSRDGDWITVERPQPERSHVRPAGGDFATGDVLLRAGTRLGPAHIMAAAAADHATLPVQTRPTIAFLANGDELRAPGRDPGSDGDEGSVIAANYYGLAALARRWGAEPVDLGIARDTPEDIARHIDRASGADIIVPVGGASVGDHDHMFAAFEAAGFATVFRKIAVKPGKPTWCATKGKQVVLGLPGNPASAYVCAHLFLRGLVDGARLETQTARLGADLGRNGGRETFLRASSAVDEDGTQIVTALPNQASALISPFLQADCLIRRMPGAGPMAEGEPVEIMPLTA